MKNIQIIIPVCNESANIEPLAQKLASISQTLARDYQFFFLWVNDGSSDDSLNQIKLLATADARHAFLDFSRNFGKEAATSAGLHYAQADAVILMDADFQHPPALIPEFLEHWEQGAQIVVGVRRSNRANGLVHAFFSRLFYLIMNVIGETAIVPQATDFRLLDRQVVEQFKLLSEKNRITRGLIDWLGFERTSIDFDAPARQGGQSKYGKLHLIKLALSAFVAHSIFPLKFTGYLGLLITFGSGVFGLYVYLVKYIWQTAWGASITGTAMLAIILVFLSGTILSCMGLLALYIAQLREEALKRPMYIIREDSLNPYRQSRML